MSARRADHPIEHLFIERWSRRALTGEPAPDDVLQSVFEAARWAPSARNAQPWRFLFVRPESPDWPVFLGLLYERNQVWAKHASALIAVVSERERMVEGQLQPWRTHAFDAGAAWALLALQAARLGWSARAMGGFDRARAPGALNLPPEWEAQILIGFGRPGSAETLPEHLQALEQPNTRRPVADFVTEGRYQRAAVPA